MPIIKRAEAPTFAAGGTTVTAYAARGDCLIVPPGTTFSLGVRGAKPFRALVCLPCGAQATVAPDGASFVPPWAQ